ncbi:MAG: hypothetical protein ACREN4_09430 [Candidatus Dormibacteria bacterium]
MAARRYPAAKDPATGKFCGPWIWRDQRGERPIYWVDPLTAWEDERAGPPGRLRRLLARILGLGEAD